VTEPTWVDADDFDGDLDQDFDAAWAEHKPKHVKIKGRIYRLPPEVPANVMILMARQKRASREDGLTFLEQILKALLSPAGYDQILSDGIGLAGLGDVLDWCMKAYDLGKGKSDGGDGEGEAQPPATGATE